MTNHEYIEFIEYIDSKLKAIEIIESKFDKVYILERKKDIICQLIIWNNNIIECKIEESNMNYYYLHFEISSLQRCKELIYDFLSFKDDFFNNKSVRILICCSGEFTSSLLVDGINRIIKEMNYRIIIEYGSYFKVDLDHTKYDLVLLAPQISYLKKQYNGNIPIEVIPTNVYAASNYHLLLTFILNNLDQ